MKMSNKSITKKTSSNKMFTHPQCRPLQNAQEQELAERLQISKQELLQQKKMHKFQETIQKYCKQIASGKVKDTMKQLVDLLLSGDHMDIYEFKGIGIDDLWVGHYPQGPLEWFGATKNKDYASRNPFDMLSVCIMVELLEKRIQMKEVQQIYQSLLERFSQSFQILLGRGNAYYNNGQFLKAEQQYLKALQIKESQLLYEILAWLEGISLDRDKKGIEYCEKCLKINPDNLGAKYVKIQCLQDQVAILQARKLIMKYPDYYRIYVFLGNILEDHDQRIEYYKKSLFYDPNYMITHIQMAISIAKNDQDQARSIMAGLQAKHPNSHKVYWGLGQIEMELGNINDAIQQFKKALEVNPYHFGSMKDLAYLYKMEGHNNMCIYYYQQFLQLNPYDEQVYNYLGLAHDDNDNRQEGIECYKKAIELNPEYFQSLSNLGLSYQQDQRFEAALKCYVKAHEVSPENGGICYGMSICYEGTGQLQEAEKWALKCIQVGGDDDNEVYEFMGDIFFKMGNHLKSLEWYLKHVEVTRTLNTDYIMENLINKISKNQAIEILHTVERIEPVFAKIYYFLQIGKILIKLNEPEEAIRNYNIVKNLSGGGYVPRVIKNQLKKVYGDPSGGVYCLLEMIRWENMRKQYYNTFKELYENGVEEDKENIHKMEVE